jgi:myo-inositol-1-phosphate synthase
MSNRKLGIAIIGLGGAVGTTMVAGIEILKKGVVDKTGLPLANLDKQLIENLADYENIVFGGWDLFGEHLAKAAEEHDVLTHKQFVTVEEELRKIKPWRAVGNKEFLANIEGENKITTNSHRETIEKIRSDLRQFKKSCDEAVVINLASTEKLADEGSELFNTLAGFEKALNENSKEISPAMLYAYSAIAEEIPYGNFTPSVAADIPALVEFAEKQSVPVAGKDGKTGQTFIKTVLAPALKSRALKVEGWYSTNILGNRDGLALSNEESLASKVKTKGSVLDDILGYRVEDHIVDIRYYRPRGDNKEAWDNIDIRGFLGQSMQIKVNFLCKDSILAAPLAIEIARCLDLAKRRGEKGVQEQLSVFFKLPMTKNEKPEHAFHRQEEMFLDWLKQNQQNYSIKSKS